MARGGKRPGAGRPPNARRLQLISMKLLEGDKLSPLDIMLNAARAAYQAATLDPEKVDVELLGVAVGWAKDAAPFVHPRLMTAEIGGKKGSPLEMNLSGQVQYFVPESGRRVAPAAPANDAAPAAPAAAPSPALAATGTEGPL